MLTTETSFGIFDRDSSAMPGFVEAAAANSLLEETWQSKYQEVLKLNLRPRERTLEVTVCGKHEPR